MIPLLGRLLRTTGGRTVVSLVALYLAFQAVMYVIAPAKIDPAVARQADAQGRVDVVVELNFAPERFHILVLQDFGRVTGSQGNSVEVRGIRLSGVQEVARKFWVRSVRPLEG